MAIDLTSPAFVTGEPIPIRFTGDGEDVSPPLHWSDPPSSTLQFALVCDDPDAPAPEPWVHWLLYNLSPEVRSLPEGLPAIGTLQEPVGAAQGQNGWGRKHLGYRGPAPPRGHGSHHYHFKLFALDMVFNLKPGIDKSSLLRAIEPHVLDQGELIGVYERR